MPREFAGNLGDSHGMKSEYLELSASPLPQLVVIGNENEGQAGRWQRLFGRNRPPHRFSRTIMYERNKLFTGYKSYFYTSYFVQDIKYYTVGPGAVVCVTKLP